MFRVRFLFRPAVPPRSGPGAFWVTCHSDCGTELCIFLLFGGEGATLGSRFSVNTCSPTPLLPGDMAVDYIAVYSPLRIGLLSFPFFVDIPCRLRSLGVPRCGSGF